MTTFTREDMIQNNKDILNAIKTKLTDTSIIESTLIGKTNSNGAVQISGANAKTQYDSLQIAFNTLSNNVMLEEAGIPGLQLGYTQLKDTDLSCVYGSKAMYSSSRSFTSELGATNLNTFIYPLLSSVLKIFKTSTYTSLPNNQRAFRIEPTFVPNLKSNFINSPCGCEDIALYSVSDSAGQDFMIFALKNPTGSSKTFAFDYNGSAYTTYSRLVVSQYIPSITDSLIYAGNSFTISLNTLADITSSTSITDRTVNITIPAGFSSIIVFQSAVKYFTTNFAARDAYIRNIKTNLEAQGIVQNSNIMEIFRRVIEGKRINKNINFTDLALVEDVFKYKCGSLTPNYATNNAALTALELPGNQYYNTTTSSVKIVLSEFSNNAAAIAGGLVVGDVYYNTTTSEETLVV